MKKIYISILIALGLFLLSGCGGGGSSGSGAGISQEISNIPPVALATATQNVQVNSVVNLDGSASSDANGDALIYSWTISSKPNGSTANLSAPLSTKSTFIADIAGAYVVTLVVNDGKVNSAIASININATNPNIPPVADAGKSQNVQVNSVVNLDGSASSDANGDALIYSWTISSKPNGSTANLSAPLSTKSTFIADMAGAYVVTLVVNDGKVNSAIASININATNPNIPPVADAGTSQNVQVESVVNLDGSASSDANGDALIYSWTLTSKPTLSLSKLSYSNLSKTNFKPDKVGIYIITLEVSNKSGLKSQKNISVTAGTSPNLLNLMGILKINYQLNGSTSKYNNSAYFVSADLSTDGSKIKSVTREDNSKYISCSLNNGNFYLISSAYDTYEYQCWIENITSSWDIFLFNIDKNNNLSGVYKWCPSAGNGGSSSYAACKVEARFLYYGLGASSGGITPNSQNSQPIALVTSSLKSIQVGTNIFIDGSGSYDPEGSKLTYKWEIVAQPSDNSVKFDGLTNSWIFLTPYSMGDYVIDLTVNDGLQDSSKARITIASVDNGTSPPTGSSCCRICSIGKACGDSCISKTYICRVGNGCAC